VSDDWLTDDPFADPDDPRGRERAERRAERERKRQAKAEKKGAPPPPPAEPPKPPPPPPKRSPEQEFWDEDPTPDPESAKPVGGAAAPAGAGAGAAATGEAGGAAGDPDPPPEKKRRGLLRRRRDTGEAAASPPTEVNSVAGESAAKPGAGSQPPAEPPAAAKPSSELAASAEPSAEEKPAANAKADAAAAPDVPEEQPPAPETKPVPAQEKPATAAKSTPVSEPAEPTREQPLPPPVPAPEDPTRPATGEHPVPDPDAPHPDAPGPEPVAAGAAAAGAASVAGSGQTSEEWATVPTARSDWAEFADDSYHDEGHPEMAGAARTGKRRGEDGGRRGGGFLGALARHPFRIAAVILLLVVLWFLNSFFQPFHGDGHGRVQVRIAKGSSVSEVAELLEKRGVIDGSTFGVIDGATLFQMRVLLAGKRSDLISGPHTLRKGMSYGDAIDALTKEPTKKQAAGGPRTVTIPEGYTRGQAAPILREDGVPGNYKKATVKSKYLDPAEYGGKQAKNLEGFLFPDTFELKPKAPVKDLVQLQLQDFKRKIKQVNMKYARSKNLTVFDVVTIASMIEREAGVAKQRKLVASVIYNRLHEGIPLGIDATIRFATGNFEKPLTESELATESPYNTRLNQGLPPGPINSPGLAAIQAAAHPADTEYIYYVNNPDSCNELTFAKTEAEFNTAVAKYEKAREANGGNAPSTCGN
jgi:UPF0755 protein